MMFMSFILSMINALKKLNSYVIQVTSNNESLSSMIICEANYTVSESTYKEIENMINLTINEN